jgi:hypothetical protein
MTMIDEVQEAIEVLAAAIIKANPGLRSSDEAYRMCLYTFRQAYFDQRAKAAASKSEIDE